MALVAKVTTGANRTAYTLEEIVILTMAAERKIGQKEAGTLLNSVVPQLQADGVAAANRTPNSIGFAYREKIYHEFVESYTDINADWVDEKVKTAQEQAIKAIKATGGDALKLLPPKVEPKADNGKEGKGDKK